MTDEPQGEFTVITEPMQRVFDKKNPIAMAYAAMLDQLRMLAIPHLPVNPEPEDFEDMADFGLRVAGCFDRFWKTVGDEAQSNATCNLDMKCFTNTFSDAMQGWATFEFDREAAALREERQTMNAVRYGRTLSGSMARLRSARRV
jgi:hypothetical protein